MPQDSVITIPTADEAIGARLGLQHVRKIFGSHRWFLGKHLVRPHNAVHHLACNADLTSRVDRGWVFPIKLKFTTQAMRDAKILRNLPHATLYGVKNFCAEGANGALQFTSIGNHIAGQPSMHHRD